MNITFVGGHRPHERQLHSVSEATDDRTTEILKVFLICISICFFCQAGLLSITPCICGLNFRRSVVAALLSDNIMSTALLVPANDRNNRKHEEIVAHASLSLRFFSVCFLLLRAGADPTFAGDHQHISHLYLHSYAFLSGLLSITPQMWTQRSSVVAVLMSNNVNVMSTTLLDSADDRNNRKDEEIVVNVSPSISV